MLRYNIVVRLTKNVRASLSKTSCDRLYATTTKCPAIDAFQQREMMNHKLILVDENDRVVGSDTKLNCHVVKNGDVPLHRAFSVLLFNSKNELVLQQRSATKAFAPNHVTNICCSHPLYDDSASGQRRDDATQSVKLAAVDRLIFELGMSPAVISTADLQCVGRILYKSLGAEGDWGEHEVDYIFVLQKDLNMVPHPMEVKQVWSVSREKFDGFVRNLQYPLTPWFKILVKDWLFKIWDNLDRLETVFDKEKIHKYKCD